MHINAYQRLEQAFSSILRVLVFNAVFLLTIKYCLLKWLPHCVGGSLHVSFYKVSLKVVKHTKLFLFDILSFVTEFK